MTYRGRAGTIRGLHGEDYALEKALGLEQTRVALAWAWA